MATETSNIWVFGSELEVGDVFNISGEHLRVEEAHMDKTLPVMNIVFKKTNGEAKYLLSMDPAYRLLIWRTRVAATAPPSEGS